MNDMFLFFLQRVEASRKEILTDPMPYNPAARQMHPSPQSYLIQLPAVRRRVPHGGRTWVARGSHVCRTWSNSSVGTFAIVASRLSIIELSFH